jgi:RNA polymerase sigma-70 factor (ECF subfamily)
LTHMDESKQHNAFIVEYGKAVPRLRAFLRQLLPTWYDVDEVLQETSLVLWKKFDEFEMGSSFVAWAHVIARYEVLKYRRKKSRDRHIFSDEILELLAEECQSHEEEFSERRLVLKACFTELAAEEQQLLLASYARDLTIKELAEQEGKTPGALYKTLDRLRVRLVKCVNMKREEWAYE